MKIIGVTGSSGSGKNVVCELIKKNYGAEIIDADKIAKELSKKGTVYLNSIVECFGVGIIDKKGELNRKKLVDIIFKDDKQREKLNKLTFIYVVDEIKKKIKAIENDIIIINAPLLFESKLNQICNFVIAVIAKEELQVERVIKRDGISEKEVKRRLQAQKSDEFLEENADYIIENNDSIENLEKKLLKIPI